MAIHSLVKIGNLTTLTQVIDSCPQQRFQALLNGRDCEGLTSVHLSCVIGRLDVLLLLRNKGASLTARDIRGRTPLIWAALKGSLEIVRYLLTQPEVDPTVLDFTGDSPLHYAASQGRLDIVAWLCQHEHQQLQSSSPPPQHATFSPPAYHHRHSVPSHQPQSQASHCSESVSMVGVKNLNFGMTPLELAASWGRLAVVKLLREYGAEVNTVNNRGLSPLHFAAQAGNLSLVEYLVSEGASAHVVSKEGRTPLDMAANDETRQKILKTKRAVPQLQRLCIRAIRGRKVAREELEKLPVVLQRKLMATED